MKERCREELNSKIKYQEKNKEQEKIIKELKLTIQKLENEIFNHKTNNQETVDLENSEKMFLRNSISLNNGEDDDFKIRKTSKSETIFYNKKIDIINPKENVLEESTKRILREKKELENKNLLLEEEIKKGKIIKEIYLEQISSFINELRNNCSVNYLLKNKFEELKKINEDLMKENKNMNLEQSIKIEKIADFEKQISDFFKLETEFKKKLEDTEKKIVKPHDHGYIYVGYLESILSKKKIFIILRKNINREIVLEIENENNEHFFLNFKNILKIEKSKNNINKVKITQKSIFNKVIILEFQKESSFYEDLKKFWSIFISSKKLNKNENEERIKPNFLTSIKNIIIN